ncbi:phosphonoacetate hydrolase [Mucilaginibacter lappiensis]|uniref:Phosphonoacetate hydrolase n=1 Tax=Mucilaginibacter lappiensis TaxID=354630 RepID=A0A1N6PNI5_9SPHI|nr:phosphonoacetate hydrolase [Mucilaginibacter lappiensis]MBB6107517.1 phosphonoacetate hydrolase [Mucilaginibacter lappiensis]MBB6126164.1 phosphonoacetate hydrolase [Mucilaginibacter lappiensis]SIQ05876.1 phosphonoacetate hydrolase [Mucilaginibacter lappiensis]
MNTISTTPFSVNGKLYTPPAKPIVVICMDGSADEYLDTTLAHDRMPNLKKMALQGYRGMVRGALPSFTNVNNSSIVTGVSPAVHGICGNFFYDAQKDQEVMMNSSEYLRTDTLLAAAANAGRKVAVVTAKEKLRDILSYKLNGIAFSAEKANQAKLETHGIENAEGVIGHKTPVIYSAEASLFVLRAGVAMIEQGMADFLYLSLTDYMQHTYAPDTEESLAFYEAQDIELGKMLALGAIIGATADHGMNAKVKADGSPNVLFIETMLTEKFGAGFRVICPITDPYVKHHGALGSYVVVHVENNSNINEVKNWLAQQPGITEVYDKETGCRILEQPADRTGDLFVLSARDVVVGKTAADHDLKALDGTLRSHGGRYEEMVPLVVSHPLNNVYKMKAQGDPRNFDVFDFAVNGTH